MTVSPISGALSAAQITAVQQVRPAVRPPQQAPKTEAPQAQAANTTPPRSTGGRGQIVNITV